MLFTPPHVRFDYLADLPEGADLGRAIDEAMTAVEETNRDLAGVLPGAYAALPDAVLVELVRLLGRTSVADVALKRSD